MLLRKRKRQRLAGFDYTSNRAYFITVCTHLFQNWFGEIANGEMQYNEYAEIVEMCWFDLPNYYSNCELDAFVIMCNHIHGIIIIDDSRMEWGENGKLGGNGKYGEYGEYGEYGVWKRRERSETVPYTGEGDSIIGDSDSNSEIGDSNIGNNSNDSKKIPKIHGLSQMVGSLKSFSARRINEISIPKFRWHKSFYDNIIRDDRAYNNIANYIENNPKNWQKDKFKLVES